MEARLASVQSASMQRCRSVVATPAARCFTGEAKGGAEKIRCPRGARVERAAAIEAESDERADDDAFADLSQEELEGIAGGNKKGCYTNTSCWISSRYSINNV